MEVKILAGRILVDFDKVEEKTASGLYLPNQVNKKPTSGKIVVCGNSLPDVAMEVSVGAKVAFREGVGEEVTIEEKPYLLMEQRHILYFI